MLWDDVEHDVLPLSSEIEENSWREPRPMNFGPERIDPKLVSELVENCEAGPDSVKS